jgi:glutamyl-tRNA synthetase
VTGPRVRFAPSPTGYFHVGSARTSLFNYLFARGHGGTFILRIEDTDASRGRQEWTDGIISAMNWLGLTYDEGPTFQSHNAPRHAQAAEALWAAGHLYACDCTSEVVQERTKGNPIPGYDGHCRDRHLERGPTTALRFRVPDEGSVIVRDQIRGDIEFQLAIYEDFVVLRSNGGVLYPLANAVDDRDAKMTHIIRGEDLLPTTPKQILMWEALSSSPDFGDVPVPLYAHLPLLVNEQRKKLSKRKDPVSVESYRDEGYLPQALVNFFSLCGWSPREGDEIQPIENFIAQFELSDVTHSPAFFDMAKMRHINGEYVRRLSVEEFLAAAQPWLQPELSEWRPTDYQTPWAPEDFRPEVLDVMAPLVQERVTVLSEVPAMVGFFFRRPEMADGDFTKTIASNEGAKAVLADVIAAAQSGTNWTSDALHALVAQIGENHGMNLRKSQAPVRLAVTGALVGPPLFESLEVLGRDEVVLRLTAALERAR